MSNVWYCVPSARHEECSTLPLWQDAGYRVAQWRDPSWDHAAGVYLYGSNPLGPEELDILDPIGLKIVDEYPGYAKVVNALVKFVLEKDPSCNWIVTGGDDIEPDKNHTPEEIAADCSRYFGELNAAIMSGSLARSTFGVMQPTGDRWGDDPIGRAQWPHAPAYIDRVAGSPWIGREYALRVNGGQGPIWPEYWHMFEDEEVQEVAVKLGVFWQRRDLTQHHRHWMREHEDGEAKMPEFLKKVSGPEHWKEAMELFTSRKAAGFPGHQPL